MGKRGTRRSWGESRRPTRSASSFSASPSANPVSTRKRTATPACPSPTPVRGGTTCSTCANRSSASARRRPVAACVSTRAPLPAPWPSATAGDPIATRDRGHRPRARRHAAHAALRALRARAARALLARRRPRARRSRARGADPAPRRPSRRRTVEITGRTVGAPTLPRLVQIDRRRPARRAAERVGARPDRLALWAVVLGFFLIFVAVTSTSHAATRAHSAGAAGGRLVHQQVVRTHTATLRATPRRADHRSGRPTMGRPGRVAVDPARRRPGRHA